MKSSYTVNKAVEMLVLAIRQLDIHLIPVYIDSNGYVVYAMTDGHMLRTVSIEDMENLK